MNATDILVAEHRVIEQVLNCLEKIIERAMGDGRPAEEPLCLALLNKALLFKSLSRVDEAEAILP